MSASVELSRARPREAYSLYGLSLRSEWALPFPTSAAQGPPDTELLRGEVGDFIEASQAVRPSSQASDWFAQARLADGSVYLRWRELFEFLVSADGCQILGRPLRPGAAESFHCYLLGQVLSFALIKRGIEPLHATAVVVNGRAIAFIGDCGYGKSSLGAAFLRQGHTLLVDDLLVVRTQDRRGVLACAGPPRIKLFPEVASAVLGPEFSGTRMNANTSKLLIPLPSSLTARTDMPLSALYVLGAPAAERPDRPIAISTLSPREACLALVANTFNTVITEPARLGQQLGLAAALARRLPVKSLSYPRELSLLPAVVDAIRADLGQPQF